MQLASSNEQAMTTVYKNQVTLYVRMLSYESWNSGNSISEGYVESIRELLADPLRSYPRVVVHTKVEAVDMRSGVQEPMK
jgi:hypothetical protein